jgi:hypothetical protein
MYVGRGNPPNLAGDRQRTCVGRSMGSKNLFPNFGTLWGDAIDASHSEAEMPTRAS